LENRLTPAITLSSTSWTAVGPAPLNNGEVPGAAAVSGRVTGVATDPTDANTIYIASAGGGVWKTTDGGTTWSSLTDNLFDSSGNAIPEFMGAVAVAPSNNQVLYAGTGEANNGAPDANYGEGILVSTDGGSHWTLENPGGVFTRYTISKIAIDPKDPNVAYAAVSDFGGNPKVGNTGIWKRTLDPVTGDPEWNNVTGVPLATQGLESRNEAWSDVVIDPTTNGDTAVLYAAAGTPGPVGLADGKSNGVWKSTDGGTSWTRLSGLPFGAGDGRIALALSHPAGGAQALYASIATPNTDGKGNGLNSNLLNLEVSTDGGTTWTPRPPTFPGGGIDDYLTPQGWYDNVVAADPTNPNRVFVAGVLQNQGVTSKAGDFTGGGILESVDGGMTWQEINDAPDPTMPATDTSGPHTDYHALAFEKNNKLIVGNDGGVWRLTDTIDVSKSKVVLTSWADLNAGLNTTQFYSVALDPTNADIAYGGSQDNGTEKFTGSLGWTRFADSVPLGSKPPAPLLVDGDGGTVRVDPTNPNRIYQERAGAGGPGGTVDLHTSNDGGQTFVDITGVGSPTGLSWNPLPSTQVPNPKKPDSNFNAPYVLDSAGDVFFGTDYLNFAKNPGPGASPTVSWSAIGTPKTASPIGGDIFNPNDAAIDAIAVAPSNPDVVYVSVGGDLFVTQDAMAGGTNVTWMKVDLPSGSAARSANSITVDPNNPGTAYAVVNAFTGGGKHVFKTVNFGADKWTDISNNLPDTPVNAVVLGPDGKTLYVGTDVGVYTANTVSFIDDFPTWYNFGAGLTNVQVDDLEFVPSLNILAAGTHGRGMYEIVLPPPTVNVKGIQSSPLTAALPPPGFLPGGRVTGPAVSFLGHTYQASVDPNTNKILVSMDGGPGVPVGEESGTHEDAPSLAVYNGQLDIAWTDTTHHLDVTSVRLRPDGVPAGVLDFNFEPFPGPGYTSDINPALAPFGDALFMAWTGDNDHIFLDFINTVDDSKPLWGPRIDTGQQSPTSAGTPALVPSHNSNTGQNELLLSWGDEDGVSTHTATVNLDTQQTFAISRTLYVNGPGGVGLGNAQVTLQVDPNNNQNLQVSVDGNPPTSVPDAGLEYINLNGDSNTLTMDFANGNPFPGGASFDAGTGTNTLALKNGNFMNEVETPSSATSGTVVFDGFTFLYSNISTITDTVPVSSSATFNAPGADEAINVVDAAGPANGLQATRVLSGAGGFAPIIFANKPAVTISALSGPDIITLINPHPADGLKTLNFVLGVPPTVNFLGPPTPAGTNIVDLQDLPPGITSITVTGHGPTTLEAPSSIANKWIVTGTGVMSLDKVVSATGITNVAGTGTDEFDFEPGGSVPGFVDGGPGHGLASLDYSALTGPVTVNLQTNTASFIGGTFTNINNFVGSASSDDTLIGDATWDISGANSGSVNGLAFSSFENLTGGSGNDQFIFFPGGSISGNLDGGGGSNTLDYSALSTPVTLNLQAHTATGIGGTFANISHLIGGSGGNTLVGPDAPSVWAVTGPNAFTVGGITFSAFQSIVGGSGDDRFVIQTGGSLSGSIDGGGGVNTLDYSRYGGDILVDLALHSATGVGQGIFRVQNVTGSMGNSLLVGDASANVLTGGTGRNVIIGGGGPDSLIGGGGDNILIAGFTAYDQDLTALQAIMAEWDRTDLSFEQRVAQLISNGNNDNRLNGSYVLNQKTVFSDGASDSVTGGGGLDWVFMNRKTTTLAQRKPADHITEL
jgi:hypothetical protein